MPAFLPISLAGTASSNSNARTSVNRSTFILCSEGRVVWAEFSAGSTHKRGELDLLDEGEPVADACSGAAEERQ